MSQGTFSRTAFSQTNLGRPAFSRTGWGALLAILLLLVACDRTEATLGCIDDTTPTGSTARVFPAARCGLDVTVSIPEACANGGCGLILDIHGFGMDADIQDRNTNLRRLGVANGFVVAQPTARVGLGGLPSFDTSGGDADRIHEFTVEAIRAFRIDPRRIHVGGFFQGGTIAFDFVCRYPGLIASAAPLSSTGPSCFDEGPPVPILQAHGTKDAFVSFDDALTMRDAILTGMDLRPQDGRRIRTTSGLSHTRFQNPRGQTYEWIEHDFTGASAGEGHCLPGSFETDLTGDGPGIGTFAFGCEDPNTFRIGEVIMEFYLAHPKQAATRAVKASLE